jgi:hypothetical protein
LHTKAGIVMTEEPNVVSEVQEDRSAAAAVLGRKGGKSRSKKKVEAARKNAKKAHRVLKEKRKHETTQL